LIGVIGTIATTPENRVGDRGRIDVGYDIYRCGKTAVATEGIPVAALLGLLGFGLGGGLGFRDGGRYRCVVCLLGP
jgi:hypothetical protein